MMEKEREEIKRDIGKMREKERDRMIEKEKERCKTVENIRQIKS